MSINKKCDGKTRHKSLLSVQHHLDTKSRNANDDFYMCECGFYHIGTSGEKIKKGSKERYEKRKSPKVRKFKNRKSKND